MSACDKQLQWHSFDMTLQLYCIHIRELQSDPACMQTPCDVDVCAHGAMNWFIFL